MPPSKYQKKLLNIWKTFDPSDLDAESELNEFIMKYHPSVGEMKDIVSKRIDDLNKALNYFADKELREKLVKFRIKRSWSIFGGSDREGNFSLDEDEKEQKITLLRVKESIEDSLLQDLFGFFVSDLNNGLNPSFLPDGDQKLWSRYDYEEDNIEKDLDSIWESMWERLGTKGAYLDEGWFIENEGKARESLKDLIWKDSKTSYESIVDGLKTDQIIRLKSHSALIPDDYKKELKTRLKEGERIIKKYLKAKDEYDKKVEEFHNTADDEYGLSGTAIRELKAKNGMTDDINFTHYNYYPEQTWDREFVTEDLWGDLDLFEVAKEQKAKDVQWESWFKD